MARTRSSYASHPLRSAQWQCMAIPARVLALAAALAAAAGAADNVLASKNLARPNDWGAAISIPADTGTFEVKDQTLTLHRKRPGGDFKLYRVTPKLRPDTDYVLSFQLRVDAAQPATVGIFHRPEESEKWTWLFPVVKFAPREEWQTARLPFRTAGAEFVYCLEFFPPSDVGGRVTFGPLSIVEASALASAGGSDKVYPCFRLAKPPVIDGKLEDDAWRMLPEVVGFCRLQAAPSDDGLQVLPDGAQDAVAREFETRALTYFQAGYTDRALYVAVRCYQPKADRLPAGKENNAQLWREDCAEIHVVPGTGQPKLQVIVNPAAAQWPEGWQVKTTRRRGAWLAEAEIPFALIGKTPTPGARWPVNISRHATTPADSLSTWAPNVVNFHDVDHYRVFAFQKDEPKPEAKDAAELALNAAFFAHSRRAQGPKQAGEADAAVRTCFTIHTRNVRVALFAGRRRLPLKAEAWLTSYKGFEETTLRAVSDLREGPNVVAVLAQAHGPEPGIRIEAGRAATDAGWKCAAPAGSAWLKDDFDDRAWTPIAPGNETFYWLGEHKQLCFRQVIRGVEPCPQDVKYSVCDWKRDDLGRHRAIVRVPAAVKNMRGVLKLHARRVRVRRAVWAHIPWRRRDPSPETKAIRVFDAKTGKRVKNTVVLKVKQEYGDIVFEPPTVPGDYEIYYLPYVTYLSAPCYYSLTDPYTSPHQEPDPNWVASVSYMLGDRGPRRGRDGDITKGNWQRLPRAELVEIQAKTEFDRFDPMEVAATREEIAGLLEQPPARDYLVFPEDRKHPVRMFETLPLRWIKSGPKPEFRGQAQPDEYYCYQLAVYAARQGFESLEVAFSDLRSDRGAAAVPAKAMTCFNLTGVDWLGSPTAPQVSLGRGRVRPLWIGVPIPKTGAGVYAGSVTVSPDGLEPQTIAVRIDVSGETIAHHGDDEPWRHSRLRWLNSTLGLDDDWLVPPYTPLTLNGSRIGYLDREVDFGPLGLPAQVTSRGNAILHAPMRLSAKAAGARIVWKPTGQPETKLHKKGKIVREFRAQGAGITLTNTVTMEFDGCVLFDLALEADRDVALADVGLDVPYTRATATYIAGADAPGGYRPASRTWTFDAYGRSNSKVWLGSVNAGMQLKATRGRGTLEEAGDAVLVRTREDNVALTKGERWHSQFRLLITPFKPIGRDHWRTRLGSPLTDKHPAKATIVHIHHANRANPWINYPFLYVDKLQDLQRRIEAQGGLGVQLYYTVRELTTRAVELWALRSLGSEVLNSADRCYRAGAQMPVGNGYPWLREHLVTGYTKAWRTRAAYDIDAAVGMRYLSRWHNYYLEGLDWLLRNKCFYSLYLDGIGYDREVMKRVARIMSRHNPNYRMEHHQCTSGRDSVINRELEHIPFVTELWYGESFNYNRSPDYWLVDVSGIPFGVTGELLDNTGTINLWRAMLYGITGRVNGKHAVWKFWDDFGIAQADWLGYWDAKCPVRTCRKDVLATVYRKPGQSFIAIATWSQKPEQIKLKIDWKALGLDPATARLHAPAIEGMQEERSFAPNETIPVKAGGGWFLIAEKRTAGQAAF